MGTLRQRLENQLTTCYKKDAEDCIETYNTLKALDKDGAVWSSKWTPLVDTAFKGWNERIYKPSTIGNIFLKGIRNKSLSS